MPHCGGRPPRRQTSAGVGRVATLVDVNVACGSCGATYVVADHKIAGRRVRVRCKSCKSPIIVEGAAPHGQPAAAAAAPDPRDDEPTHYIEDRPPWAAAGEDEPTKVVAAAALAEEDDPPTRVLGRDALLGPGAPEPTQRDLASPEEAVDWHVTVGLDDTRGMTVAEVVEAYRRRVVTEDTLVWRDGLPDWRPVREVDELLAALSEVAEANISAEPLALVRPGGARPVAARRVPDARVAGGRDLFGESERGASAPPPPPPRRPRAPKVPTPRRSSAESSGMFSLQALKAGADDAAPDDRPGMDVLGLAAPSPLFGTPSADALSAPSALDAPGALAEPASAPTLSTFSSAPDASGPHVPAPRSTTGRRLLLFAGLAGLSAAAVVAAVLIVGAPDADGTGDRASPQAPPPGVSTAAPAARPSVARVEPVPAPDPGPSVSAAPPPADEPRLAPMPREEERVERRARDDRVERDQVREAAREPEASAGTPARPEETTEKEEPRTPTEAPVASAEAAAVQHPPFAAAAARAALESAAGSAPACKRPGGPTGSGRVTVTFAPSGRVTTATVSGGDYGGSAVGGCVAGLFRRARVPPFDGAPTTVAKSFNID